MNQKRLVALVFLGLAALAGVSARGQGVPGRWEQIGPDTSRPTVNALAFDPLNPQIAYAGMFEGGVASTEDGGNSWTLHSPDLGGDAETNLIAVSPAVPRVVFAATFHALYKSPNRGRTWRHLAAPESIAALALDPKRPAVAYLGAYTGLYKTTDGGETWERLALAAGGYVTAIAIDPVAPDRLYVGAHDPSHGDRLSRSIDGGKTWASVSRGLPRQIVVDPANPQIVFNVQRRFILKSIDSGDHWTGFFSGSGQLTADPSHSGTLYMVTGSPRVLLKTLDGGRHWHELRRGIAQPYAPWLLWAAPSAPDELFLSNGYGNGLFSSHDGGAHWGSSDRGLVNTQVGSLAIGGDSSLYAGGAAAGQPPLSVSHDRGATWRRHLVPREIGGYYARVSALAVAPGNPRTVYAGAAFTGRLVWKSTDAGTTWRGVDIGVLDATPTDIVVDPRDENVVYVGLWSSTTPEIRRSTDGGVTWTALPAPYPDDVRPVTEMAIDMLHADTLYAAVLCRGIFKSENGGQSWKRILAPPDEECTSHVTLAPSDPNVVYAAGWTTMYRSDDAGATWSSFAGLVGSPYIQFADFGQHPMAVDPTDPRTLYVAGTYGVSRSVDGGAWVRLSEGLVFSYASTLRFDPTDPGLLYVGTSLAGIFVRRVHP